MKELSLPKLKFNIYHIFIIARICGLKQLLQEDPPRVCVVPEQTDCPPPLVYEQEFALCSLITRILSLEADIGFGRVFILFFIFSISLFILEKLLFFSFIIFIFADIT